MPTPTPVPPPQVQQPTVQQPPAIVQPVQQQQQQQAPTLESNTQNEQNQLSNSNSHVETAPRLNQYGSMSNYQINNAMGVDEFPKTCMEDVGCVTNPFIGFSLGLDNIGSSGAGFSHTTTGYGLRVFGVIPLGGELDEQVIELAEQEVKLRTIETNEALQRAMLINAKVADQELANLDSTLRMCANLKQPGKTGKIKIDPNTESAIMQKILHVCDGLTVEPRKQPVPRNPSTRASDLSVERERDMYKNWYEHLRDNPNSGK